jgi:hypothetical protein
MRIDILRLILFVSVEAEYLCRFKTAMLLALAENVTLLLELCVLMKHESKRAAVCARLRRNP